MTRPTTRWGSHGSRARFLVAALLLCLVLGLYARTAGFGLVYDDESYLVDNGVVSRGLTPATIAWAFSSPDQGYVTPLVYLSFMAETTLFGFHPAVFHLTNALLHAGNALLLFFLFASLTGAPWKSGLAAALFAVHPIHVESVAWISERKDVLSTCFMLLALTAWARALRRPRPGRGAAVAVGAFFLALLSKPTVVHLPLLLLLLDWWPLGRGRIRAGRHEAGPGGVGWGRLVVEKIPFLAASAAMAAVTLALFSARGVFTATPRLPVGDSLGGTLVSLSHYLGTLLWPARLAVNHVDFRLGFPAWQVALAAAALALVSAAALFAARRRPEALAGWLWYLVALAPMTVLPGTATQPLEDHYAYVPAVGLYVALVWSGFARRPAGRLRDAIPAALLAVGIFAATAWLQVGHWRSAATLFDHALAVTSGNWIAHYGAGKARSREGRAEEARRHYEQALRIRPDFPEAHNDLGVLLARAGRSAEAESHLRAAVAGKPGYPLAWYNLGLALGAQSRHTEAVDALREAVRLKPEFADGWNNLGVVLAALGRDTEAAEGFRRSLAADPGHPGARANLAQALARAGR